MSKEILILFGKKTLAKILIDKNTTVEEIVETGNDFLREKALNPNSYSVSLLIDDDTEIPGSILLNPKYSKYTPYKQIKNGVLKYEFDDFSQLNKDAIAIIISKLDSKTINDFCLTSKRMLNLCEDEDFWKRVNIYKYGRKVTLRSPHQFFDYPNWKSRFLDTDETSQMDIDVVVFNNIGKHYNLKMTPYTPLIKFYQLLDGLLKSGNFYMVKGPVYDFKDLNSFPSGKIPKNIQLYKYGFPDDLHKVSYANTLEYFNNKERFVANGKIPEGKYYSQFIQIKPYFRFGGVPNLNKYFQVGLAFIGFEFNLSSRADKGWIEEIIYLPVNKELLKKRDFHIFKPEYYERLYDFLVKNNSI